MTAQTKAEALEASILHWQENLEAELPGAVRIGVENCALCSIYYDEDCEGCPVSERTTSKVCQSTPYGDALNALTGWEYTNPRSCGNTWRAARDEFRRCAQAEVDFLISLRETD